MGEKMKQSEKKKTGNVFLNSTECKQMFAGKEIYIFGTGIDAEQAQKELSQYTDILAYIDNHRFGKGRFFFGKSVISLNKALEKQNNPKKIIIVTYRFAMEIYHQLEAAGLLPGKDFFVWDDMHLFHADENAKEYIKFLKNIWAPYKKEGGKNKILVMFDNKHNMQSVILAYCSNYFAQKYDAEIYGYFRFGADYSNASYVLEDIYKAFNVKAIINSGLNESLRHEADEIFIKIWKKLYTWEDWKNITVYGICFGTTIIRELLRVYIPSFNLRDEKMQSYLKESLQTIVFWHHYISENNIKAIFLGDGVSWDGYIRDIAVTKGIPTYALAYTMAKVTLDYCIGLPYQYFKNMWSQLSPSEQEYGLNWAQDHIEKRLQGGTEEIASWTRDKFTFAEKKQEIRILEKNKKLKIMICPHIFEEDCYFCGEQIFDNNYFAWLCHLGELSNITPDYDWYLKMHPHAMRRDFMIIDMILNKYPKIKKIPANVSPIQLKEEGISYALTVYGTIGHEYPNLGIQVINAGNNPHSAFDFTWNPRTKKEYDDLIMNLYKLEPKKDTEGMYQFYSLNYLYYNWNYIPWRTIFFQNPLLPMDWLELRSNGLTMGTWMYKEYMKEWTSNRHEKILEQMEEIFQKMDDWRPDVLYRK